MNWMLWILCFLSASTLLVCGVALGSALCNRRWSEKCSRCQTLMGRVHTTPTALHVTRGDR
jgi:hypothetical protein